MESIGELKKAFFRIYSQIEHIVKPIGKLMLAIFTMILINANVGYMDKLKNPIIVFAIALISAFLPLNALILIAALVVLLHMYALCLPVAAIIACVFVIMFVLYFRFTPKEAITVLLTPLFFVLKLPYVVILITGFVGGIFSFIPVACGTAVYYMLKYVGDNETLLSKEAETDMLSSFKTVIDKVLNNNEMIAMIIAVVVIVIIANVIKRFSFDYSWQVALVVSAIVGLISLIITSAVLDAGVSILGAVVSMFISVIIVFILQLFIHDVDYSNAEYVQFEDDEFFYYVKAIPKFSAEEKPRRRR